MRAPPSKPLRAARWLARTAVALALLAAAALAGARALAERRESVSRASLVPAGMRVVATSDGPMALQEAGPPTGRAVVLVHGTGAWSEIWRPVMSDLAAAGYRVLALDMPPFGFSGRDPSADYRAETQARRIWGALEARGVARVTIVGHSFGARAAVAAALAHPERVERLVLVDAALGLAMPAADASAPPGAILRGVLSVAPVRDALVAATITNPAMTRRLMNGLVAHPESLSAAQLAMLQHPMRQPGTTAAYAAWLPGFLLAPDPPRAPARQALARLAVPVHVIWGALDVLTPPAHGRDLAGLSRCATWDELPGVGHIPGLEAPAPLAATLRARLDAPPPCATAAR